MKRILLLTLLTAACSVNVGAGDPPGGSDAATAAGPDAGTAADPDAGPSTADAAPAEPDAAPSHGGKEFLLPWQPDVGFRVTQGHNTGSHTGNGAWAWDFGLPEGTDVLAAHDGVVRRTKSDSTIGGCSSTYANDANYVVLDRGDGLESLYLHLSAVYVSAGQTITRGELLGKSGQTGWACGAHLHFQIQMSPDGGGTTTWYNPSVHEYFYDTGDATDPAPGTTVVSKNGVIVLP